ncbi:MAG: phosphatase PAP2 family protein [Verrucomicrobia bacterium]|nr:phosphatase PAP2 family protein [Verrucomicrobiota bacterium]
MKHYTFIDYVTQGYLVVVAVLILVFHGGAVPAWPWLVSAHLSGMILVHWLIRGHARCPGNRSLAFLRHFYPVLLYVGFFRETGELNQMFASGFLDPVFIRLEEQIFGAQPSLTFMDNLPYWPVSELFYASYFSYYVMITGVGLALYLRDRQQFFHYVSVVSFVFYVCYLTYIFTPVTGPRIFYRVIDGYALPAEFHPEVLPDFPAAVQAGPFFQLMAWIYENFESSGAAFPSSHVAVALTTLYFSWRYLPRIRFTHLVMAVLLCLSTVYCRYHYVVDVAAGILTAALLVPLGNWLYFRYRRPAETTATARLTVSVEEV